MAVLSPIKNQSELSRVLEHYKARSSKIYIVAMLILQTGASLVDVLDLRLADMMYAVTFTNKKNGVMYIFPDDFSSIYNRYCSSLNPDSVFLFPNKKDFLRPMTAASASRQLTSLACEVDLQVAPLQLQKTFAFNYFKEHGNLDGMHVCCHGYRPEALRSYLCLTDEEYDAYVSGFSNYSEPRNEIGTISYVSSLKNAIDLLFDDYMRYLDSSNRDVAYEEKMQQLFRKFSHIVNMI